MILYWCEKDKIQTKRSTCPVCGGRCNVEKSEIYWCDHCRIPLYESHCSCGGEVTRLTTDIRPVFPEERLLIEIVTDKPFAYQEASVWNGAGNHYFVNGKKIPFSVKKLRDVDVDSVRCQYEACAEENRKTYDMFNVYIARFVEQNQAHLRDIDEEALSFIKQVSEGYSNMDMFVSFSGGKDSSVTSDLAMRGLGAGNILHVFGDTTLEFPQTEEYVARFKKAHPKTPVLSAKNTEKDFYELCMLLGPPSRVMRWCCTIFKTGAITRKIQTLFRGKKRILTFYGIRRSESASRNKYDREVDGAKITKQVTVSPIIDWLDFDVWLYLLSNGLDFNDAYRYGYARVGCWCCPNNSEWSEFLSQIHQKEAYEEFHKLLVTFARGIGKRDAEEYVKTGKWKARQGGNGVSYAGKSIVSFTPCVLEENTFNYELQRPLTDEFYELFYPFGYVNTVMGNNRLGEVYITRKDGTPLLRIQGRIGKTTLKISILDYHIAGARSVKIAEDKIKCQLTKYQMCMGCRACEGVCKHDAIALLEMPDGGVRYQIREDKCVRCGECVNHFIGGCYIRKVLAIKR